MKKYILGTVLSVGLLVSPAFAHQVQADGLDSCETNAIIQLLQAFNADSNVLTSVQTSLGTPTTGVDQSGNVCQPIVLSNSAAGAAPTVSWSPTSNTITLGQDTPALTYSSTGNPSNCKIVDPNNTNNVVWNSSETTHTWPAGSFNSFTQGYTRNLTCSNSAGTSNIATYTLTVQATSATAPTINSLTASAYSISKGMFSILSYSSSNIPSSSTCSIDNGVGSITPNTASTKTVFPTTSTTYTLSCTGVTPKTVTITVSSGTISANTPSCTIALGASSCTVNLNWTITGATNPKITNSSDSVYNNLYTSGSSGTVMGTVKTIGTTLFGIYDGVASLGSVIVSATCASGSNWINGSCQTSASVSAPTVTSSFNPSTISPTGSSVYSYSSQGSTHCVSSHPDGTGGWDNIATDASFPPTTYTAASYPTGLTTTITCYNAAGQSAVSTQTLTVTAPDYTAFFTTTYQTELGRVPDSAGLAYWINQLMTGVMTQASVTSSLHNSPEAVQYRFLRSLYQTELGRVPDSVGLAYWINQLMTGVMTQASVTSSIHNSADAVTYRAGSASALNAFSSAMNAGPSESPGTGGTTTFHYVWNNNLQIGSSYTEDVKALQTTLTREGVYTGEISGGFYSQTFTAVKAFQQKYGIDTGISGAGFVGLKTREKLNTLY